MANCAQWAAPRRLTPSTCSRPFGIGLVAGKLHLDAGIVDEDVEPAEGLEHRLEHRLDRGEVRHVGAEDEMGLLAMPGLFGSPLAAMLRA